MNSPLSPLEPACVEFRADGTLYSSRFEDVYASASGALEQARHVFLGGNGLPDRWRGREAFTIVETGFGAGLNFLATWNEWRGSAPAGARLHYVSVEKHPFYRDDLAKIHERHPGIAALGAQLQAAWPVLLPGFHRLHFEGGRLTLTLLFGDAAQMLAQLEARADAFFLDGFAPARNEAMWSDEVFGQLARLAAPGATCATYSVAAKVRSGLSAAGFDVDRRPGFASKHEMLAGASRETGAAHEASSLRHALIVGAGLAGTTCAQRLVERGWKVDLVERHAGSAQEASGNPAGLIRPVVSADWNTHSRFTTAGFLYAANHYRRLQASGHGISRGQGGVLQLARDARRFEKQQALVEEFALPADFLRTVSRAEATDLAGMPVSAPGWWFPEGFWASPATMCRANLEQAGPALAVHYGRAIASIERSGDRWQVRDAQGNAIASAPVLILANAFEASRLELVQWLPIRTVRGQVTFIPASGRSLNIAVSGDGYVTPAIDGMHCVGASFNEGVTDTLERVEDHAGNLERLGRMVPALAEGVRADGLKGRVAFRAMAKDRLPVLGGLELPGLYGCLALGSRGMTWSALAAEMLASRLCDEPLPMERDLVDALAPARFR